MHLERLKKTAELLDIPLDPNRLPTAEEVETYVRSLTKMEVVIRLNVSAGRIGKAGTVWMSASLPPKPTQSVRLRTALTPIPRGQPQLTWKTFQYSGRLRVTQQATLAGYDTALLLDPEGNLLEAAHANLFVRLSDGWATPEIGDGLFLPGTVRQYLLENSPIPIRERTIPSSLLGDVREAFLTNSGVGIVPITQIDESSFNIGEETMTLSRWLEPRPRLGACFYASAGESHTPRRG